MSSELERLRDRVDELEELLGINPSFTGRLRAAFKLSEEQAVALGVLLKKETASEYILFAAIYGGRSERDQPTSEALIRKHIHFLRKRLKPHGISISNVWGQGWLISSEHKQIVKERVPQIRHTVHSLVRAA